MAKRLIDAEALPVHKAHCVDEAGWGANFYVVDKSDIDNAPTVDAVEVVRCRECKHGRPPRYNTSPEKYFRQDWVVCQCENVVGDEFMIYEPSHFCSYGERKEK